MVARLQSGVNPLLKFNPNNGSGANTLASVTVTSERDAPPTVICPLASASSFRSRLFKPTTRVISLGPSRNRL